MKNKILKTKLIDWKKLKPFQPDDFKNMSKEQLDKLKESFKKNGFASPFYVWEDKEDLYCLDGHTRVKVFKLLLGEGVNIPEMLPANFVDCKNKKEAKKAVLIYNSHYANIEKDSLFEFVEDLNLQELKAEIDIHDIDFNFDLVDFIEEPKNEEIRSFEKVHVLLSFSPDLFIDIQKYLDEIRKITGVEIEQSSN